MREDSAVIVKISILVALYSVVAPNILTLLRGFQEKLLNLALFSLYPSLFWELRDKRNSKNLQFWPESLGAMLNIDISNVAYCFPFTLLFICLQSYNDCTNVWLKVCAWHFVSLKFISWFTNTANQLNTSLQTYLLKNGYLCPHQAPFSSSSQLDDLLGDYFFLGLSMSSAIVWRAQSG